MEVYKQAKLYVRHSKICKQDLMMNGRDVSIDFNSRSSLPSIITSARKPKSIFIQFLPIHSQSYWVFYNIVILPGWSATVITHSGWPGFTHSPEKRCSKQIHIPFASFAPPREASSHSFMITSSRFNNAFATTVIAANSFVAS